MEQSFQDCSHDFSSLSPNSGFQNKTPIPEIIKGTFSCLDRCPTISSWWVVGCFELNQTCTYPPSNSIMWLLMPSHVASGNKAIFQLLISSPFSTHPARIVYSSMSESPQKRYFFLWQDGFQKTTLSTRTNKQKSSVHCNLHNSEEVLGSWCCIKEKNVAEVLCVVFFKIYGFNHCCISPTQCRTVAC